jgi:hypothetical protein
MGAAALTARLGLSKSVQLQLSLRDNFFLSRIDSVNGCTEGELNAMERATRANEATTAVSVGSGCRSDSFDSRTVGMALGAFDGHPTSIEGIFALSAGISARF